MRGLVTLRTPHDRILMILVRA